MDIKILNVATGEFVAYLNGEPTKWSIVNGSTLSGRGRNSYAIVNGQTGQFRRIGSLAACKTLLTRQLSQEAK